MKIVVLGVQQAMLIKLRAPLLRDMLAAGHEVIGLAPEPEPQWTAELAAMGVRYVATPLQRTGTNPLADIGFVLWLWRWLRTEKPDIVFSFQTKAVIYGSLAGRLAGIARRVAMIEGLGRAFVRQQEAGWKHYLIRWINPLLYRLFLRCADTVFFLNPDDLNEFRQRGLITARQRVLQIPGIGVDLARFPQCPLPVGKVTVLMIARLLVDKGVREFVAAASLVRQQNPDIRFVLYGRAETGPGSVPADEITRNPDVEYVGDPGDVRPYLAGCHIYALPSYREGLPLSVMEAMATGRAIVTTDVPGARETVVDGHNGCLVQPYSPQAVAAAVLRLAARPDLMQAMGQASRTLAESRYEVGQINRQILSAILGGWS